MHEVIIFTFFIFVIILLGIIGFRKFKKIISEQDEELKIDSALYDNDEENPTT